MFLQRWEVACLEFFDGCQVKVAVHFVVVFGDPWIHGLLRNGGAECRSIRGAWLNQSRGVLAGRLLLQTLNVCTLWYRRIFGRVFGGERGASFTALLVIVAVRE